MISLQMASIRANFVANLFPEIISDQFVNNTQEAFSDANLQHVRTSTPPPTPIALSPIAPSLMT